MRFLRPLSLIAVAGAFLSPGLVVGPSEDAAVYALVGERMRSGALPYVDMFDNKPPGVYIANAVGQSILPWLSPWLVAWILSVAAGAVAVVVFDWLLRRYVGSRSAWVWSVVCCAGVSGYLTALGGGLTETYAMLPLSIALYVFAGRPPSRGSLAAVGGLMAAACLVSLQCAPVAALVIVLYAHRWPDARQFLGGIAVAVAAALAVVAPVGVWLVAAGMLPSAVEQILPYNEAYRTSGSGIVARLPILIIYAGGAVIPAAMGSIAVWRSRAGRQDHVGILAVAWVLAMAAYLVYQNRLFPHYLIISTPPLIFLCAIGLAPSLDAVRSGSARVRRAAVLRSGLPLALLAVTIVGSTDLGVLAFRNESHLKDASHAAADWLRDNEPGGATLFVWGYDPDLYLSAGLRPASEYLYLFPLITPGFGSAGRTAGLLAEWQRRPPAVVVESKSSVPLNRPATTGYDQRDLDTLAPLRDFVNDHYRLAASFGDEQGFDDVYVLGT
jgi:hypothetical protein